MFASDDAKRVAIRVHQHSTDFLGAIRLAVEESVVGHDEVRFVCELAKNLTTRLNGRLGALATTRAKVIHKKPVVNFDNPDLGKPDRCELGDLLYVVKYPTSSGWEAKSIVWQMKSCTGQSAKCALQANQLVLLHRWPEFEFGRDAAGVPVKFAIKPVTIEFGSFMLMLRKPIKGANVRYNKHDYGIAASGWRLSGSTGPIDIADMGYTLTASDAIFNHIAFGTGEPHSTPGVQDLVNALYRHAGLNPDPPDEFEGYFEDYSQRPDHGAFAIIETVIKTGN